MTNKQSDLLQITRAYLNALEEGKSWDELSVYYAETVEQIEYPNRLLDKGTTRNLTDLKEAFLRGKQVLLSQTYDIQKAYVVGNTVILETLWKARAAISICQTPPGEEMKAYFAQFIEFEDGKIIRQRTYDCFEPF